MRLLGRQSSAWRAFLSVTRDDWPCTRDTVVAMMNGLGIPRGFPVDPMERMRDLASSEPAVREFISLLAATIAATPQRERDKWRPAGLLTEGPSGPNEVN